MNPKRTFIIIFAVGLILEIALIFVFVQFVFLRVQNSFDILSSAKNEIAGLEKKERLLRQAEETIEKETSSLESINVAFLRPNEVVSFLEIIERVASASRVDLEITSAEISAQSKQSAEKSIFKITANGDLDSMLLFTELLEYIPYHSEITNFDLSVSSANIRANITLSVLTQS